MTSKKSLLKTKWKMFQSVGMKSFSEKPPSITVWFMVALAARKFQRYESNKYKMSLRHFFDRESAIKELSQLQLSKIDKTDAVKLAYLIRKFELTFKDLPFGSKILGFIHNCLCQEGNINQKDPSVLNFLCISLKFLTRNLESEDCNPMELSAIIELLRPGHVKGPIRTTLMSLLMTCFEKHLYVADDETLRNILNIADLDAEANSFFLGMADSKKNAVRQEQIRAKSNMAIPKVKKNKLAVSKTVQSVKAKQTTQTSEETDVQLLNLADGLKNRNKNRNHNMCVEDLPDATSKAGDDRSMFRNTWDETVNLYSLAVSQGNILKDDDKDNYLPSKLFGSHWLGMSYGKALYSYFIQRMCAAIFFKISRRQQLNNAAIDQLMRCLVGFDQLLSTLEFKMDNIVDTFVDYTYNNYSTAKELQSPDFAVDMFKKLIVNTTEEYISKGWFYNTTEHRRKSYDRSEVKRLIVIDLNRLRSDAVKAIYNAALRNKTSVLTKDRLAKITSYAKNQDGGIYADPTLKETIFKLLELAETLDDFDYKAMFKMYIGHLKNKTYDQNMLGSILRFMSNQARDLNRSQQLFTDSNLAIIIESLTSQDLDGQRQLEIMEIINTLMEHETSKCLSDQNLKALLDFCLTFSCELKNAALTTLLWTTDKSQQIPSYVLDLLMKEFTSSQHDEHFTSFVIFILSRTFCGQGCIQTNNLELISSKMFSTHMVQLNDDESSGQRVRFENVNEATNDSTYLDANRIGFLTSKIILNSVEKRVILSSVTIDNLISVVITDEREQGKQSKIIAAKSLYYLTKYMSFPRNDHLNQLLGLIDSPIYDVGVYIQTAYIKQCSKIAFAPEQHLDSIHMENISSLYVSDNMKLGTIDFAEEINKNFFKTLLYEGRKDQHFIDKNIFCLFDHILSLNEKYVSEVLAILLVYTVNYLVPEATVASLEKLLGMSEYFEKVLQVLKNIIIAGKMSVSNKALTVFSDYLYLSNNSRCRFYSFKLLEKASSNQELPDNVFYQHELTKSGYALQAKDKPEKEKRDIFHYIEKLVDMGMPLSIDVRDALVHEVGNEEVLKIFGMASRNKQIIPEQVMEIFIQMFHPTAKSKNSILLIQIFENMAKNNQKLPPILMTRLEEALHEQELEQNVFSIFIYLAQTGEVLSKPVISKLLDQLVKENDPVMKQELLSSLGSLIQANRETIHIYQSKIHDILAKQINSDNHNIVRLCVNAAVKLVKVLDPVDVDLLEKLVQVGMDQNTNKAIKQDIYMFFENFPKDVPGILQMRQRIQMANLTFSSSTEILCQLESYVHLKDGMLPQNYHQLKEILDNENVQLQEKTLDLLHKCSFKAGMTDELLESVAVLYQSTLSESLRQSCVQLFKAVAEQGKKLNGRASNIYISTTMSDEHVETFLHSQLGQVLIQELTEKTAHDLVVLVKSKNDLSSINSLADLIILMVRENSNVIKEDVFVLFLEKCLLTGHTLEIALPFYCRVIKEFKKCQVECLEALVQQDLGSHEQYDFLLEAMFYTSKFSTLPESCMSLALQCIESQNHIIRGYSFGIFRAASKAVPFDEAFKRYCEILKKNLLDNWQLDLQSSISVDLLEAVVSVAFLDVEVFRTKDKKIWQRELLISDIFKRYQVSYLDQINFYKNWFVVEKSYQYFKSCKILLLIQKCQLDSFETLLELTEMLQDFTFEQAEQSLVIYTPNPFQAIKQEWTVTKVLDCMGKRTVSLAYSRQLSEKLASAFDIKFLRILFQRLKSIDNLRAFENLIDFCLEENIDLKMIFPAKNVEMFKLTDLREQIEVNLVLKLIKNPPISQADEKSFASIFSELKNGEWSFEQLKSLAQVFSFKFFNLVQLFSTLFLYKVSPSHCEEIRNLLISSQTFHEIIQKVNKLAIENHFQREGKEKDLNELVEELGKLNIDLTNMVRSSDAMDIKKHIYQGQADKFTWSHKQIQLWARQIKTQAFNEYEGIAVIFQANFLITGHRLTYTQILCCLIALREERYSKKHGKLLQVATGEGKSTIICVLAIIKALRGHKVDVITSSPVLAERDAQQKAQLYRMFDLTVSDNRDKTVYLKGPKDCYKADIVYGEMSQFQFDILRDNYSQLGTLAGRQFNTAVVDEVDSMLIDDSSKIARLSSTVPGMDHLQALYVYIWQYLTSVKERFIMFKEKLYLVDGKIGFENGKITLDVIIDESGQMGKIPDLESYIAKQGEEGQFYEATDDLDEFLRKKVEEYLEHQLKNNKIYIPSNFANYVAMQKSKWITNAVEALNYRENVHYVVHEGEIKPVDFHSTGIVQSSTSWSDGLHQFLQLKHNLKMTCETLTTNFLSNMGYMSKYQNIYGLTGTLGSGTARNVLKDVYNVDLINIPPKREKQFMELHSVIKDNESEWLDEIVCTVQLEAQKNRGILLICQTIEHANRLNSILKSKLRSSAVKLYVRNDMDQERNVEKIMPGEVIIATNLAGRGTDIQTHEIEETGGLHVIVTFLPNNQRVEDQAYGRTARQGKRGTGQMILNGAELYMVGNDVKVLRDKAESQQLKDFKDNELELIKTKDQLFDIFCNFLNHEIREKVRKKYWIWTSHPTVEETCILAAVEEQWADFLAKLDEGKIACQDGSQECEKLICNIRDEFQKDMVIKNPYYYIAWANDIISNSDKKAAEALIYFNKAIQLEEDHWKREKDKELKSQGTTQYLKNAFDTKVRGKTSEDEDFNMYSPGAAHVGVAWCTAVLKTERGENYKDEILESLKTGLNCLSNEMSVLNSVQLLLQQRQIEFVHSDLDKQLNLKATILGSYLRSIDSCSDAVKRSKRLIDVVSIKRKTDHYGKLVTETRKEFREQERKNQTDSFVKDDLKLSSSKTYIMTFNHLTKRHDSGAIDQALITLDNAFKYLPSDSNSVKICLNRVDLSNLWSTFFNNNKEFMDLTLESAVAKLKEERSIYHTLRITNSSQTKLRIHTTNSNTVYENKQINELISIIEDQDINDTSLRFDLTFKNTNINEINKCFNSTLGSSQMSSSSKLEVTFGGLSKEDAMAKVNGIKARSVNLEFALHKSAILEVISANHKALAYGVFCNDAGKIYEKVNAREVLERINNLKNNETPIFIRFEDLSLETAKNIIEKCHHQTSFGICFKEISDYYNSNALRDGQIRKFCFDKLNHKSAQVVINTLRDKNMEFCLEFVDLTEKNLKSILKNANLEQEHIDVMKPIKTIKEMFMNNNLPTRELEEFISKGIEFIIQMNEKLFIPWRSVCAVGALALGQVLLGGALILTGFGASVGMGLVSEGMADGLTAYRAYSTRQFQWQDYCTQKAISLAISAVSMGFTKMKDAAKGVKNAVSGVAKGALEESGKAVITSGQSAAQKMITSNANLHSLAWKYIGVKAAETAAREALNQGVTALSNYTFDCLKPSISQSVQNNVWTSFSNPNLKCLLFKLQAIDMATNSQQLQTKIEGIVADIVKQDNLTQLWNSIGLPLVKGILSDPKYCGNTASMAFRISGTLNGLKQVVTLTDTITDGLLKKLTLLDRNSMTITLVLHTQVKIDKETSEQISNEMKQAKIFNQSDNFSEDDDDANFKEKLDTLRKSSPNDAMGKCVNFVESFHEAFVKVEMDSFSQSMKIVSDKITEQLIQVMDSQMLQPWSTMAVSGLVDSISSRVQHYCLVNKDENSLSQKEDEKKFEELSKKENLTKEESIFMANYGRFTTFADQINSNSKDFCIAYSQCEMVYHAQQKARQNEGPVDENVKNMSKQVEEGGPANLAVMMAAAEKNGVKLKIVDIKDYELTQEDIDNGVKVIYVEYGEDNKVGHAYYMDSTTGKFVDTPSTGNDCFFEAFSKILENDGTHKSASDLRAEAAQQILKNSANFSQVFQAEDWVRTHHPDASNALLLTVGLREKLDLDSEECDNIIKGIYRIDIPVECDSNGKPSSQWVEAVLEKMARAAERDNQGDGYKKGREKHRSVELALKRIFQGLEGVGVEETFDRRGTKGRLDVVDHNNNVIYDFKFGYTATQENNTGMSRAQYDKYSNAYPGYTIITINRDGEFKVVT